MLEGLQLAVFGMTAVFVLLGCLVLALGGMSRLARVLEPLPGPDAAELTVAVAAAIHAYRGGRR